MCVWGGGGQERGCTFLRRLCAGSRCWHRPFYTRQSDTTESTRRFCLLATPTVCPLRPLSGSLSYDSLPDPLAVRVCDLSSAVPFLHVHSFGRPFLLVVKTVCEMERWALGVGVYALCRLGISIEKKLVWSFHACPLSIEMPFFLYRTIEEGGCLGLCVAVDLGRVLLLRPHQTLKLRPTPRHTKHTQTRQNEYHASRNRMSAG